MKGDRREVLVRLWEKRRRLDVNSVGASVHTQGTMRGMVRGCGSLPGFLSQCARRALKCFATAVALSSALHGFVHAIESGLARLPEPFSEVP